MTKLILTRSKHYFGVCRKLKVLINNGTEIELKHGETKSLEIPEGDYSILAKMDWGRSKPLSLRVSKEGQKHVVIGSKNFLVSLLYCFLPPFEMFTLKEI